ncbi:hypothetical protein OH492_03995 [Vibrio chagasii]|nr:hypothetical protein [Vibrio chagasii]
MCTGEPIDPTMTYRYREHSVSLPVRRDNLTLWAMNLLRSANVWEVYH